VAPTEPDSAKTTHGGGLLGTQQFKGTYPNLLNDDQRRFDAQLDAMNPAVALAVPAPMPLS
ncbi:MAG: hypothetical protein WCB57_19690, partial [Pseudonocardiaceae bacterium]